MSRKLFDFQCQEGHVTESFVNNDVLESDCKVCGQTAARILTAPRVFLDPISGDFPGATMSWAAKREKHMKYERKLEANNGPDAVWDRNKGL